ncbi:MAG: hypothetical protein V1816_25620 [Pseudomonadota bacterium]
MTRMLGALIISLLLLTAPAAALGFDCENPPFGASLDELNKDGYFVKYLEKGVVDYYNYTGACRILPAHSRSNPAVSWAFIDDHLYARIIKISGDKRELLEKTLQTKFGPHAQMTEEGDWTVFSRKLEDRQHKTKFNNKTGEVKGALYYEPLRAKLKPEEQHLDPANLEE